MIWRQELEDDAAIIRTAEVRYINTAEVGPYESHDLSGFCTTETHAVKVGAYILSRRVFVSHTARFAARPQAHNRLLSPGSIIRVKLGRNASGGGASEHDYLYQVERIGKTLAGDVSYECSHFPIDSQGRSIIALNVANATGTGILLTSNSTGVGCDINSATDNTIPVESFIVPGSEFDIGGFDTGTIVATGAGAGIGIDDLGIPDGSNLGVGDLGSGFAGGSGITGGGITGGGGEGPGGSEENPSDEPVGSPLGPFTTPPVPGGAPGVPPEGICPGGVIERIMGNIGDEGNAIRETVTEYSFPLTPPDPLGGDNWNGKFIEFRIRCPNGEEQGIDPLTQDTRPANFYQVPVQTITVEFTRWLYDYRGFCSTGELFVTLDSFQTLSFSKSGVIGVSGYGSYSSSASASCGGSDTLEGQDPFLLVWVFPDGSTETQGVMGSNTVTVGGTQFGTRAESVYVSKISGTVDGLLFLALGTPSEIDSVRDIPVNP
jgi:hypothetical protein